ncbi:MAG TPA: aminopeptidase, partial [Albitalea sp.]|nr:aminopeptidase [Albitalea sp.]
SPLPDEQKRSAKAALMAQLRADYAKLKAGPWGGFSGYDAWFAHANNASLGVLSAYNELVPAFERLFEREGRDFTRFYAEVKRLAALPKDERRAALTSSGD